MINKTDINTLKEKLKYEKSTFFLQTVESMEKEIQELKEKLYLVKLALKNTMDYVQNFTHVKEEMLHDKKK